MSGLPASQEAAGPGRSVGYLSLEAPREGQAAHTHIHAIIDGLEAQGWRVTPFLATRTGVSAGRSLLAKLVDYVAVQARLIAALPRLDAVYVRAHPAAWPASIVARWCGRPVVHEINGPHGELAVTYPWLKPFARLVATLQRAQYRRAAHLVAVTPGLVAWAKTEAGHDRVTLVPNAADVERFTPNGPRHVLGDSEARPYAIFVGGLVKWHGIATMLDALAHPDWPDGVALVVVGDGIERDRLARAQAEGMPGLVWFGRQPQEAVPAILRGALVALVPIESPDGRADTGVLPLKLYEAMACGLPLIASDLPGQADLVREEGAGWLVPPGDAGALARAVAAAAADPEAARRIGASNAEAARLRHGWRARAAVVSRVLTDALSIV